MTITSRTRRASDPLVIIPVIAVVSVLLGGCQFNGNTIASGSSSSSGDGTGSRTTYTIDDTVQTISFKGRAGHVEIRAKDGPISVTERASFTTSKPVTSHDVSGKTLELREEGCPDRPTNGPCQVEWDITAPAGTVLDVQTNAGGIDVFGMAAQITVRADAGGVEGHDLTSRTVDAKADSGGVELDFTQAPDSVSAETDAGGVTVTVPGGTSYAVDAGSDAGGKSVDVQEDPSSPHKIRARSGAGGVEVTPR
ncbi:MAG TPA: DUF4097 family beta strand repeat-containing protein [Pseudonocardia sp.]|nr:DUF4097 family beta strand repeat-containing protein [Pseudonocardia sp.]